MQDAKYYADTARAYDAKARRLVALQQHDLARVYAELAQSYRDAANAEETAMPPQHAVGG